MKPGVDTADPIERRVLILAPIGRDARAAAAQFRGQLFRLRDLFRVDDLHKKLDEELCRFGY